MEMLAAFFGTCALLVFLAIGGGTLVVFEFVNEEDLRAGKVFKVSDNLEYQCKPTEKTAAILAAEESLKKLKLVSNQ